MTDDLRKYLNILGDTKPVITEMVRLTQVEHGINDVVVWVGPFVNSKHGPRVKVSGIKNRYRPDESFVITMPHLDYNPKQVPKWIEGKILTRLLEWIKTNQAALYDFEAGKISFDELKSQLEKG